MLGNKEIIKFLMITTVILIFWITLDFLIKCWQLKKTKQHESITIENLHYNLNPSEKVLLVSIVEITKYRSTIKEVFSQTSVLGLGINFGIKAGKQINHKKINANIGQVEETIKPVKLVVTNQRIIIVAIQYSLAIRHLNILGIMFEGDNYLYLLRNQKSMIRINFTKNEDLLNFKKICMEDTYLAKRLKNII